MQGDFEYASSLLFRDGIFSANVKKASAQVKPSNQYYGRYHDLSCSAFAASLLDFSKVFFRRLAFFCACMLQIRNLLEF